MDGGRPVSIASGDANQTRTAVAQQLGDANFAAGGLTLGRLVDGGPVGPLKAMYRKAAGTGNGTYTLKHSLGIVPSGCVLWRVQNTSTPNTNIVASTINTDKWNTTEVQMRVDAVVGSVAGAEMWFIIGGQS